MKQGISRFSSLATAQRCHSSKEALSREVPLISFSNLKDNKDLSQEIHRAFGVDGLGIIAVSDVSNLKEQRERLLPLANKFAFLSEDIKSKYVLEKGHYSFGWSHGKEKFQGKPDLSKGSYYNNPQYNQPVQDEELIKKYPSFVHPNIWPTKEIPDMEPSFMQLGQTIVNVGLLIAKQCDSYIKKQRPTYEPKIYDLIKSSLSCKARLLHYYSPTEKDIELLLKEEDLETQFSNWCGWHNDHGLLTGLVQAMYMDNNGNEIDNPDKDAGLYVKTRKGELIRAVVPPGHLVFQVGEAIQIYSGGVLQATPHAVNGPKCTGVNRETLAVFMQPNWDVKMSVPSGVNPLDASQVENLPIGVPTLHSRWNNSMNFGEFAESTMSAYYDHLKE